MKQEEKLSGKLEQPVDHEWEEDEIIVARIARPIVTYSILIIIVSVFIAMLFVSHGNLLIGDVSAVDKQFGAKDNELIRHGQWWRFITPMFLHGNNLHLILNGMSLLFLGASLEKIYGSRKFLIIFVIAGIVGNIFSYRFTAISSLGASGAIFGLVGAGVIFPLRYQSLIPAEARNSILKQLIPIALINLYIGYSFKGIDNWAHIGGLVGGAVAAMFLIPDYLEDDVNPWIDRLLYVLSAAAVALILTAGILQWRSNNGLNYDKSILYSPANADPWWSIKLPSHWKSQNGLWLHPKGAQLAITDSVYNPQLRYEEVALAHTDKPNAVLDGKQGWHKISRDGKIVRDVYLIHSYDRAFLIILVCPEKIYPVVQPEFDNITQSLRFIHPPNS